MAEINPEISYIGDRHDLNQGRGDQGHLVTWANLGAGDIGKPVGMVGSARRTVQVVGTFVAGDKLEIQGSVDGVNYGILTDGYGNELKFNASGVSNVGELTTLIRPAVVAGAPTATVTMLLRKEVRT